MWHVTLKYTVPFSFSTVNTGWENDARCPFGDEMHELVIEQIWHMALKHTIRFSYTAVNTGI